MQSQPDAMRRPESRVYSLEPVPSTLQQLVRRTATFPVASLGRLPVRSRSRAKPFNG